MKRIYRVEDTHFGIVEFCLKKELQATINAFEARLKADCMDNKQYNPKIAVQHIDELNDFASDNIEIEMFENEDELIVFLNNT